MPNLLVIAHAVAPIGGSHSTRVTHLVSELYNRGWNVTVLATRIYPGTPGVDPSLLEKVPAGIKFIRSFPGPMHAYLYRNSRQASVHGYSIKESIIKKLMIPDPMVEWLPGAFTRAVSQRRLVAPDLILSSAMPFSVHLIGLALSAALKKPWVADYGDPWVYAPGYPKKGLTFLTERALEKKVLKKCSAVIVTTATTKQLYVDKYAISENKIHVLPMAYDQKDFEDLENYPIATTPAGQPTRFVYTGYLNKTNRDPTAFLQALKELKEEGSLKNVSFELIGSFPVEIVNQVLALELRETVKFQAWLEHGECMRYLTSASYLLLFGNNNNIQLPGKVFQYIGSGTPVVYIASIPPETDPALQVLEQGGVKYWYTKNDKTSIKNLILQLLDAGIPERKANYSSDSFTWAKRGEVLSELLKAILKP